MIKYVGSFNTVKDFKRSKKGSKKVLDLHNIFVDDETGKIYDGLDLPLVYDFESDASVLDAKFALLANKSSMRFMEYELKIADGVAVGTTGSGTNRNFNFEVVAVWKDINFHSDCISKLGFVIRFDVNFNDCFICLNSIPLYREGGIDNYADIDIVNEYVHSCFIFKGLLLHALRYFSFVGSIAYDSVGYYKISGFENCRWCI